MPQACLGYPCSHPRLSFPHLSKRMSASVIPEVPPLPQPALPLAPPSLGGEPHTTFDPPMIDQVAIWGGLRLCHLPLGISSVRSSSGPSPGWRGLTYQMAHQGMDCHTYDGSPVQWDSVRGSGEEPLSLADHMCLLHCQELAATSGNISAHPTTAASTTNALMTACARKVSLGSGSGQPPPHRAPGTMKPLLSSQLCNEWGMRFPCRGWL